MHPRRTRGYTLIEIVIVLTIMSLVLAIAVPRGRRMVDRVAVQAAAGDVLATLDLARTLALTGNAAVLVDIDASGTMRIRRGDRIYVARNVGQAHGVRLTRTRDSLTYDGRGLGRGVANLSIAIARGAAAETVFVSRLGRAR